MMELACIDPKKIKEIWPKVAPLIYIAMRRGDFSKFKPVEDSVLNGWMLLWLAIKDGNIIAAAVTEISKTETRKLCTIVACAGEDMKDWIHLLGKIEGYAKAEGCSAARIIGRDGWARVLTAYRPRRVVLEKDL